MTRYRTGENVIARNPGRSAGTALAIVGLTAAALFGYTHDWFRGDSAPKYELTATGDRIASVGAAALLGNKPDRSTLAARAPFTVSANVAANRVNQFNTAIHIAYGYDAELGDSDPRGAAQFACGLVALNNGEVSKSIRTQYTGAENNRKITGVDPKDPSVATMYQSVEKACMDNVRGRIDGDETTAQIQLVIPQPAQSAR